MKNQFSRIILLAVFLVLGNGMLSAQALHFDWVKTGGGQFRESANKVVKDDQGNTYIFGGFRLEMDLDFSDGEQIVTSNGGRDVFFAKYGPNGDFKWAKSFGGTDDDYVFDAIFFEDEIYFTGSFQNTMDLGSIQHTAEGAEDAYTGQIDTSGNFITSYSFGGPNGTSVGLKLFVSEWGNIFLSGYFTGTIKFDQFNNFSERTSSGNEDAFLAEINGSSVGQIHILQGSGFAYIKHAVIKETGMDTKIWLMGTYVGWMDFDPVFGTMNILSGGYSDAFVIHFDDVNGLNWEKHTTSNTSVHSNGGFIDEAGNMYMFGSFGDTVSFTTQTGSIQLEGQLGVYATAFLTKFDPNGNAIWATKISSEKSNYIWEAKLVNNSIYTSGWAEGAVSFESTGGSVLMNTDKKDAFVSAYDTNGINEFITLINSSGDQAVYSMEVNDAEEVYLLGTFTGTTDFDPDTSSVSVLTNGQEDVFLLKLNPTKPHTIGVDELGKVSDSYCYPNPFTTTANLDLGKTYENVHVEIRNTLGVLIESSDYVTVQQIIIGEQLNLISGLYTIQVLTNNKPLFNFKLLKE